MSRRKALGRGLRALIPEAEQAGANTRLIAIDEITPNPKQPRKVFDTARLEELTQSIKEHGVLEPIIVRPLDVGYEIVVGERRWRASRQAGLTTIPAMVRSLTDLEALELALIENIQREDLNPIEEAETFQRLMDEFDMTQEQVATRVGKSRSTVANSIRLLDIDAELRVEIALGHLSVGHAKALLGVKSKQARLKLARKAIDEGLSVRAIEQLASGQQRPTQATPNKSAGPTADPLLHDVEERLQSTLGTRVRIVQKGEKGRIEIEYYSFDEMARLLELLGASED